MKRIINQTNNKMNSKQHKNKTKQEQQKTRTKNLNMNLENKAQQSRYVVVADFLMM